MLYSILNIKISGKTIKIKPSFILKSINVTFNKSRISWKKDNFVFFILGKNKNFFNVTGLKNFKQISTAIKSYKSSFINSIKPKLKKLKIDSITFKAKISPIFYKNLKKSSKLSNIFKKIQYTTKFYNKFSGISIKHTSGHCITFFKNGTILGFGLKSENQIKQILSFLKNISQNEQ